MSPMMSYSIEISSHIHAVKLSQVPPVDDIPAGHLETMAWRTSSGQTCSGLHHVSCCFLNPLCCLQLVLR